MVMRASGLLLLTAILGAWGCDADRSDGPGDDGSAGTSTFSAEMNVGGGTLLRYGATEKCGGVGELLDTVKVESGRVVVCHQASPVTGTYTHLRWTASGEHGDTIFCEGGACPGR